MFDHLCISSFIANICQIAFHCAQHRFKRRPDLRRRIASAVGKPQLLLDTPFLVEQIVEIFEASYVETSFVVPYDRQAVLSEMHDAGRVSGEQYEDHGILVTFRGEPETIARFKSRLERARA